MGLLGLAGSRVRADEASAVDDGWRRTVDGWERKETWNLNPMSPAAPSISVHGERPKSLSSIDFHPAILALAQVLLIAAGFALWPVRLVSRSRRVSPNGVETSVSSSLLVIRAA